GDLPVRVRRSDLRGDPADDLVGLHPAGGPAQWVADQLVAGPGGRDGGPGRRRDRCDRLPGGRAERALPGPADAPGGPGPRAAVRPGRGAAAGPVARGTPAATVTLRVRAGTDLMGAPIEIGRDEARRRAEEELARAKYQGMPEWLADLLQRLQDLLSGLI